jgi:hypothetical protein
MFGYVYVVSWHYVWLCLCRVVSSRRVALIVSNQPRVHLPSRGDGTQHDDDFVITRIMSANDRAP